MEQKSLTLRECLIGDRTFYRHVAVVVLPIIVQNTLSNVLGFTGTDNTGLEGLEAAYNADLMGKAGRIVTVSSMWGQVGGSCEVAYSAAKAGVIGLTKALAQELGPSHIRVNCVAPGVILTDMCANVAPDILAGMAEETPLGRNGMPMDVAKAIAYLADAEFVTGQVLGVSGGYVI